MESGSGQEKQFDQTVPDTENLNTGRQHSFTRRNRGQRSQIVDEEAKKIDDDFWNNNPLFQKSSTSKAVPKNDSEESDSNEENDQENNAELVQEEQSNGDDDDDDDDEDYEEEMESSDDDQEIPSDEEESQSNAGKPQNEAAANPEQTVEEEKEAEGLRFYVKNHEKHFFFRPIFLQLDLETAEKQDWSYIKLPPHMTLQDGKGENDIARQCINKRYIGVPPKASEDERQPLHMPTNYSYEIFKCEDERYFIDLNIKKYKAIIKYLEDIANTADEGLRREKLKDIIKSNRMVRQKYELDETPDENQRLQNVTADINHDLENLYKKRARSDILTKKKKEILYPLIVRDQEVRASSEEKQSLTNGRIVNEITKYYATVLPKELTAPLSQKLLDYNQFYKKYRDIFFTTELHEVLFKNLDFQDAFNKNIHALFVSYRASPYSILPANLFYISDKTIFAHAIQLSLFYLNSTLLVGKELSAMRLRTILCDYFGFEIEGEPLVVDPDSQEIKDLLDDLLKYERFPAEEFSAENISQRNQALLQSHSKHQESPAHELFVDKDMNPPLQKDFKLFLPATHVENERVPEKASYGTHFYYFVIRYIYTIYLKLLLASTLSTEENSLQGLSLPAFNIYLQLTASYALDKIETMRYDLAILNLFGSKGKYLLNLKFLLYQTSKAVQSLNDDKLSNEFFDKALGKINENESEEELFTFTCDFINSADEEIKNTENFVYRFHLNPSRGWFSTSVFDIKGVFMRALKTQEKIPLTSAHPSNISPKTITVKRNPPQQSAIEVTTRVSTVTETILEGSGELLGKRTERIVTEEVVTEGGEPTVEKKLHSE